MKEIKRCVVALTAILLMTPIGGFAANHRSAPITALDHPAGITDWYAFVSPENTNTVTFIMNVDPLLEPSNGPNYFPFDPNVTYEMKIDSTYDGVEDVTFQFQFATTIKTPASPLAYVGSGTGINAPLNAPTSLPNASGIQNISGGQVVPPAITALSGAGAAGLSLSQTYTVTMITGTGTNATTTNLVPSGTTLYAVPANLGPRTMPNYAALAASGIYCLSSSCPSGGVGNIQVFAGTVDDPFFIDLGAAFDSLNFRSGASFVGTGGLLSPLQDSNDGINYAADMISGFNVNTIVLQVPISMLVSSSATPVIGTWAATYRPAQTVRNAPNPVTTSGTLQQVNRLGNPLMNELIIGTGSKDTYSMSQPAGDSQFSNFYLDPALAHLLNAVYNITVPDPPRKDLLPLVTYTGPTIPASTKAGPVSDLLRLNTAILPSSTGCATTRRLGVLGGDLCGFPNGRRLIDDVTDIALRVVAGALCGTPVNLPAEWHGPHKQHLHSAWRQQCRRRCLLGHIRSAPRGWRQLKRPAASVVLPLCGVRAVRLHSHSSQPRRQSVRTGQRPDSPGLFVHLPDTVAVVCLSRVAAGSRSRPPFLSLPHESHRGGPTRTLSGRVRSESTSLLRSAGSRRRAGANQKRT